MQASLPAFECHISHRSTASRRKADRIAPDRPLSFARRRQTRAARHTALPPVSYRAERSLLPTIQDGPATLLQVHRPTAASEKIQPAAKQAHEANSSHAPSAPASSRAITDAMRSQLSASVANCLRPDRVSE